MGLFAPIAPSMNFEAEGPIAIGSKYEGEAIVAKTASHILISRS